MNYLAKQTFDERRDLRSLAIYRLFLSLTLLSVFRFIQFDYMGQDSPVFFNVSFSLSVVYAAIAVIFLLIIAFEYQMKVSSHTMVQLLTDVLMLTLIIHVSGSLKAQLGSLIIVVVMVGGALLSGWRAVFIATFALLATLLEAVYTSSVSGSAVEYDRVIALGIAFFVAASLVQVLGNRLRVTQQVADIHADSANKMATLNSYIIERLKTGVMVVDNHNVIYLANESAQRMIGATKSIKNQLLSQHLPDCFAQLSKWRQNKKDADIHAFRPQPDLGEILPQMLALKDGDTLIFLDDISELTQQAHQMKLASLGRMAASIAHEIRNPLGAISHAAQLLNETDLAQQKEKKLLDIVNRQSDRINGIINSVLQLGQRKKLEQTTFLLSPWVESFVKEFRRDQGASKQNFLLDIALLSPIEVTVVEEQLRQIMVNLCNNAWHYSVSSATDSEPQVIVRVATEKGETVIDVLDNGPGVSETALPQLFEPFHSERSGGTGLGLFLASEMARANGLRLNYIIQHGHKGFFRVTFNTKLKGKR